MNTGCIRLGLRTRNPGTPPELGSRPRGEVVVTISADLSASWFASAPAELVQSQPQRPSADWGKRRLSKNGSISDHPWSPAPIKRIQFLPNWCKILRLVRFSWRIKEIRKKSSSSCYFCCALERWWRLPRCSTKSVAVWPVQHLDLPAPVKKLQRLQRSGHRSPQIQTILSLSKAYLWP